MDKSNRFQALFRCVSCGYQHNSDKVASFNLSELAQGVWAPVSVPEAGVNA
ncbi:MAG: hypothetical protein ACLFVX_10745 [Archaeoglobaceae archaeon]